MKNKTILTPYYLDELVPGLEDLIQPGWQLNKPILPPGDKQTGMAAIYQPLAEKVHEIAGGGDRPVSIAGDCCTSIGVLAGLKRAGINPLLLWFDAHGDFNTWETTPSGFLGGMPLAMLVGRGEQRLPQAVELRTHAEEQVILSDARDLDPRESALLDSSEVRQIKNVGDVLQIDFKQGPVYVHFDTDILDPGDAPGMNYPAPGGPDASELEEVFQHLANNCEITAVSLSSWNPDLDEDGRTREVCMQVMENLLKECSMAAADEVLEVLFEKADPENAAGMSRFGITGDKRLGLSVPEMRKIAKQCGKDHQLALELWQTGIPEAMIVAGMVDDPDQVTSEQMDDWVMDFNSWDVCDQVCMNLFENTSMKWEKISQWSQREEEFVKRAAYALIACLAWHDKEATDDQFTATFPLIIMGAADNRNFVKKGVSWALRNIGKRNPNLNEAALQVAQELGEMDSKTANWISRDAIRDMTSETTSRRMEKLRSI